MNSPDDLLGTPLALVARRLWTEERGHSSPCWITDYARNPGGYARSSTRIAREISCVLHRVTFEFLVGPIPDGLQLDHLCRVRECVNPEHLEPVTCRENAHRGFGGPGINIRKTHCQDGHEFTPENTYINPNDSRHCRTCRRIWERSVDQVQKNTDRARRRHAERVKEIAADPSIVTHGLKSTYGNWGCRCDECKAAVRAWFADHGGWRRTASS